MTAPTEAQRREFDAHFEGLCRYARGAAFRAGFRGEDLEDATSEVLAGLWQARLRTGRWPRWGYWKLATGRILCDRRVRDRALKRVPTGACASLSAKTEAEASLRRQYQSRHRSKRDGYHKGA